LGFGKKSVFWESIFWQDKSLWLWAVSLGGPGRTFQCGRHLALPLSVP
jgi:hypothetical protein